MEPVILSLGLVELGERRDISAKDHLANVPRELVQIVSRVGAVAYIEYGIQFLECKVLSIIG